MEQAAEYLGGRVFWCARIYLTDELRWFVPCWFHLAGDRGGTIARRNTSVFSKATRQISSLSHNLKVNLSHICSFLHLMVFSRLYTSSRINIQIPLRFGERPDFTERSGVSVLDLPSFPSIALENSNALNPAA